jgi:hypothetical protein
MFGCLDIKPFTGKLCSLNIDKYYNNGKLHREDGQAVINKFNEGMWFYKGQRIFCKNLKAKNTFFIRIKNKK